MLAELETITKDYKSHLESQGRSKTTQVLYIRHAKKWLTTYYPPSQRSLEIYLATKRNIAKSCALRSFINWAYQFMPELLPPNLIVPKLKYSNDPKPKDIPSKRELWKISEALNPYLKLWIRLGYETAFRASTLFNLSLADIKLKERSITVKTKGEVYATGYFSQETFDLIDWMHKHGLVKYYLFKDKWKDTRTVRAQLNRLSKDIDKRIHTHLLRTSQATHLFGKSKNIKIVQNYLKHKSVMTTERYIKITDEETEKAVKSTF